MGTDDNFGGSIPNAWMASTPGLPFWLLPSEAAEDLSSQSGIGPESTTGPNAWNDQVNVYDRGFRGGKGAGGKKLDQRYARSGWRHLYKASITIVRVLYAAPQCLVVLPTYEIYPYSWWRDGDMFRDLCALPAETFNAKKCKLLLDLEHWGSHSITYWGHSGSPNRHWDDHIDGLSRPNGNRERIESAEEEGDEQKKGDAMEGNRQAEEKKKQQEEKAPKLEERSTGSVSQRRRRR